VPAHTGGFSAAQPGTFDFQAAYPMPDGHAELTVGIGTWNEQGVTEATVTVLAPTWTRTITSDRSWRFDLPTSTERPPSVAVRATAPGYGTACVTPLPLANRQAIGVDLFLPRSGVTSIVAGVLGPGGGGATPTKCAP